ncbi:MAG: hypothetical protein AUI14_03570 [Actinobacteria bacterium 13_2_20CM_2_71_6]|nr:MAG: hypothetical protein AUI14_03570 [Actinobacteria bacterium 13_2_20CM_2_71_6]
MGLAVTALGVVYGAATLSGYTNISPLDGVIATTVGALGAGTVGAALSILIARVADREGRADLLSIVSRSLDAQFRSRPEDLARLRHEWHHYHITSIDGRRVWRHTLLRLDVVPQVGSLQHHHDVTDGKNPLAYVVEAGVRGNHAIFLIEGTSGDHDTQATEIIVLTGGDTPIHYGVGLYRAWDTTLMLGRVILSRQEIVPAEHQGDIAENEFGALDDRWAAHFEKKYDMVKAAAPATRTQRVRRAKSP